MDNFDKNDEEVDSLVNHISKLFGDCSDSRLTDTLAMEDLSPAARNRIKALVLSTDPIVRRISSIVNACYTHGVSVFSLTRESISGLISKDVNYKPNSCDTTSYRLVKSKMLSSGMFVELRPPVSGGSGKGKAGIYELVDETFLQPIYLKIGEERCQRHKEHLLRWYDEVEVEDLESTENSPEMEEQIKQAKAFAESLKKKRESK